MGGLSEVDVEDWKRHTQYLDYVAIEQTIEQAKLALAHC